MSSSGNSISVAFEIHVESLLSMSSERIPGNVVLTPHVSKKLFLNTILFKGIKSKITRPQKLGCTNLEGTQHTLKLKIEDAAQKVHQFVDNRVTAVRAKHRDN